MFCRKGSHRIRHYGLLASAKANIARTRELIATPLPSIDLSTEHDDPHVTAGSGADYRPPCLYCGGRMIIVERFGPGGAHFHHAKIARSTAAATTILALRLRGGFGDGGATAVRCRRRGSPVGSNCEEAVMGVMTLRSRPRLAARTGREGFALSHIEEWGPTDEQIAARPALDDERHRPMFLLVAARR